ncbi:hypothetical protein AgCh_006523 [Apium graveolens]
MPPQAQAEVVPGATWHRTKESTVSCYPKWNNCILAIHGQPSQDSSDGERTPDHTAHLDRPTYHHTRMIKGQDEEGPIMNHMSKRGGIGTVSVRRVELKLV